MYEIYEDEESRSRFLPGLAAGVLATLLLLATLGAAWAGHRHGGWHGRDWRLGAEWMLRWVDASPEQEQRILAIVDAAAPDLEALRARHREQHEAWVAALAGESVDGAALESLRARLLADSDAASQRLVVALADAAEVLTPEQRAELLRAVERLHHRRP